MQEEIKKQETLEEAAKNPSNYSKDSFGYPKMQAFIDGAKWQQEQDKNKYSGKEVLDFGEFCISKIADFLDGKGDQTDGQEYSMKELFEQFKKK